MVQRDLDDGDRREVTRDPLDVLADEFVARLRAGSCPSITEYVQRCPELEEDLRELLPAIALVERLGSKEHADCVQLRVEEQLAKRVTHRLGDYRIVREVGRGGMGIVYEAIQESLGRRVALKVLTAGAVHSPGRLKRFLREAQAAAKLHHTNIVPIFGVGEEDGLHYYVMQFIDGRGLDQLIASVDAPSGDGHDWQAVAGYGLQIARAVDYAHRQGVLHRDIKPANLLLDSCGTVWVTDFGLAKVFGDDTLTQSGDVLGTLRYMAPEQFAGQATTASDLYGIGITLYELATGRPAFEECDRQSLIHRITQGSLSRPRSRNGAIPVDLETIILKAIAYEPAHRYGSASELADDLERLLAGEPITARPVSAVGRMWRWSRRNPAVALLAGLSFLLLFLVALVATIGYVRVDDARRQAIAHARGQQQIADQLRDATAQLMTESSRAREEHARAEDNLRLAMSAFEGIIDTVAQRTFPTPLELDADEERPPVAVSPVTPADAELLQSLLKFYLEFAQHNEASAAVELETAKAYHRVGDIRLRLGQFESALAAYDQSLKIYDRLAERGGPSVALAVAAATVLNQRGQALAQSSRPRDAILAHADARDRLLRQPQAIAQSRECRFALAETYLQIGAWGPRLDQVGGGPPGPPGSPGPLRRRAPVGLGAGGSPRMGGNAWWDARSRDPLQLLEQLIEEEPSNAAYRLAMARYHRNAVMIAMREGGPAEAARSHQESLRILEQLRADFPDHPRYAQELADVLSLDHSSWRDTEYGQQAPGRLERAVQLARDLHRAAPHQPEYQLLLANTLYRWGLATRAGGNVSGAMAHLSESVQLLRALAGQSPTMTAYGVTLARASQDLAHWQREAGQLRASRQTLDAALLHLLVMAHTESDPRFLRRSITQLQASRRRLGQAPF